MVVLLTTPAVNVLLANQNRYIATVTLVRADIRHRQADVLTDILQQARPALVVRLPELATNVKSKLLEELVVVHRNVVSVVRHIQMIHNVLHIMVVALVTLIVCQY